MRHSVAETPLEAVSIQQAQEQLKILFLAIRERAQDLRAKVPRLQKVDTQLVLIERKGSTPAREGARSAVRVALVNSKHKRHYDAFEDEKMTGALLDRLTHRANVLEFIGESYRFRQRLLLEEQSSSGNQTEAG